MVGAGLRLMLLQVRVNHSANARSSVRAAINMTREKDVASTWVLARREGEGQTNPWSILQRPDASTPPIPPQSRLYCTSLGNGWCRCVTPIVWYRHVPGRRSNRNATSFLNAVVPSHDVTATSFDKNVVYAHSHGQRGGHLAHENPIDKMSA